MRLLSWNIHKGIGGRDRRYSLQRIIDCIDHEHPDLVCLQEVDRLVEVREAATIGVVFDRLVPFRADHHLAGAGGWRSVFLDSLVALQPARIAVAEPGQQGLGVGPGSRRGRYCKRGQDRWWWAVELYFKC